MDDRRYFMVTSFFAVDDAGQFQSSAASVIQVSRKCLSVFPSTARRNCRYTGAMQKSLTKMRRLVATVPALKIAIGADLPLRTVQRMRKAGIGPQRLDTIVQLWKWARGQK